MKIAIYSRKSRFTGKGESIENQIIKCKKFIQFKFEIEPTDVEIFIDEGFSGKNENRPEYQKMISKIKSKEITDIVIYQLNRLGRNARDIHNTMQLCEDLGTVIYSATEGFDSSTSFGRAVIGILASLAQLEREQLAERVKDNMYTLAKMGRWLGGQSPLGFDGARDYYIDENGKERSITKLTKNDDELNLVRSIYYKYLDENSLSQVAKWALTTHLKGKNNCDLSKTTINKILQNPVYVKSNTAVMEYLSSQNYEVCGVANGNGLLRFGKDESKIVAVGKHRGIIPPEVWLKIQQMIKSNTEKAPRTGKTNTALLTGILRCGCGSPMKVAYGKANKDGIKPFYYVCCMKANSGGTRCDSKNINGLIIEDKLIKYLKNYNETILVEELKNALNETKIITSKVSVESIDTEIAKCNKSIKQLLEKLKLINDTEITKIVIDEMTLEKNKIKELNMQKENMLKDESDIVLSQSLLLETINILNDFNETFDKLNHTQKQKKMRLLFDNICYKDNKFHLNFNTLKKN